MVWWLWASQFNPYLSVEGGNANALDKAFESLSKHGVQACCVWSPSDGFHQFSENWHHVCGQLPGECMGDGWRAHWHDYFDTVFDQAVQDLFSACPEDRTEIARIEGDVMHGSGQWQTLQMDLLPSGIGTQQKLTILVTDVTDQRKLRDQMRLAERQSKVLEHSRSSFLSNMSHELRTPLNGILGFAQLLEQGGAVDETTARDYLQHIRESGEELLRKISDLLELASIDCGATTLDEGVLNVRDSINSAIEMQSHAAFSKNIRVRVHTHQPHLVLRADRGRFNHCLTHLLANAIAHSAEQSEIHIRYEASMDQGFWISVEDSGVGITQRRLNNIRRTLEQDCSYYETDIENVGIGLSICKEMIELHGGSLAVDSLPGHGTIASMQLPAERIVSLSGKARIKSQQYTGA